MTGRLTRRIELAVGAALLALVALVPGAGASSVAHESATAKPSVVHDATGIKAPAAHGTARAAAHHSHPGVGVHVLPAGSQLPAIVLAFVAVVLAAATGALGRIRGLPLGRGPPALSRA